MSPPKEGSRETGEGIIISVPMDWCRSPVAVVPYRIWAYQRDVANVATTVRQTDNFSHVRESIVLRCYGDEAGTGGGIISGTHNAECTPKTWSTNVRFEDRNTVRHTDEWWMNHRNTWGRLTYMKDMSSYDTPPIPSIVPDLTPTRDATADTVSSNPQGSAPVTEDEGST